MIKRYARQLLTVLAASYLLGSAHAGTAVNLAPGPEYADSVRMFQGIPAIERAPNGRLWAAWYGGGVTEDKNNYIILSTSGDDGKTWERALIFDPDVEGPLRAFDPCLWHDPDGKLWLFWAQRPDSRPADCMAISTSDSGNRNAAWSEPWRVFEGIMMNKPTVTADGRWLFASAVWGADDSARVIVSSDHGRTFERLGAATVPEKKDRNCDEHMLVERKDQSLWMLVRTSYGIGESISTDQGKSWSEVTPSSIRHTVSRFFIRRLKSGNLLLVRHNGPSEKMGRSHLTAFLSDDDGKIWKGGLMLDERSGVSYPDGVQATDGTIYVIYDYSRYKEKQIFMARFNEADVLEGKPVSVDTRLQVLVNQATGVSPSGSSKKEKPADNKDAKLKRVSSVELAADTGLLPLWDVSIPFPSYDEMPDLDIVTQVQVERAEKGGYHYLHEAGIAWHKDLLWAGWANHRLFEANVKDELLRGTFSTDGGFSWGPVRIWAEKPLLGGESYNHPVLFSHQGKLWGFFTRWEKEQPRTEIFVMDEATNEWQPQQKHIPGFLPFTPPRKMRDGNWIIGGELLWFEAAVAISHGDDFTCWNVVQIPRPENLLLLYPETTLMEQGENLVAICRPKYDKTAPASISKDCGRTWTPLRLSNYPLAPSKPLCGRLSTGQQYLVANNLEEGRGLLSIAVTAPGGPTFCRIWKVRHQQTPKRRLLGFSDGKKVGGNTEWSYPAAVEHEGNLYVIYTHGKEDCALSIIPLPALSVVMKGTEGADQQSHR